MRQDSTQLAAAAMGQALTHLNGETCRETIIPPTLVIHGTASRSRSKQGLTAQEKNP